MPKRVVELSMSLLPFNCKVYVIFFLKKMGLSWPLFVYFSFFSGYNFNNTNWKKYRRCAWDSNPGPKDGRHRQNHGAMPASYQCYFLTMLIYVLVNVCNILRWQILRVPSHGISNTKQQSKPVGTFLLKYVLLQSTQISKIISWPLLRLSLFFSAIFMQYKL